jgi:3D (Asp-Asp-Asp) domain-containing protein
MFGAILYWVNPNIFNAKLIFFRVTSLDVPEEEIGLYGTVVPAKPAPYLNPGETKTIDDVLLTHYYVCKESEEGGNFIKQVKIQGTGKCEGGSYCNCTGCKNYWGYLKYTGNRVDAPKDACGCRVMAGKTFAVPPEWYPCIINVYKNKSDVLLYSGVGTDLGSAVTSSHIDLYVGEGKSAFAQFSAIKYVRVKIEKLNRNDCSKLCNYISQ